MKNNLALITDIKETVNSFDPEAKIILFGSRIREEDTKESDWDFLILLSRAVEFERILDLQHKIYRIEWDLDEIINPIIQENSEWESERNKVTPFYQNILKEGREI